MAIVLTFFPVNCSPYLNTGGFSNPGAASVYIRASYLMLKTTCGQLPHTQTEWRQNHKVIMQTKLHLFFKNVSDFKGRPNLKAILMKHSGNYFFDEFR